MLPFFSVLLSCTSIGSCQWLTLLVLRRRLRLVVDSSANDLGNGAAMCAIKKIESIYETRANTKRTIREIVILRHLRGHENVSSPLCALLGDYRLTLCCVVLTQIMELQRVMRPVNEKARDIYVVSDLMETDLGSVIRSNQPLSDDHVQFFVYQILRGLKYIHSANIVHRDLVRNLHLLR